ncbi:MAG: AI-2E family transporter, partial [Solirubrobacterales bacterium]
MIKYQKTIEQVAGVAIISAIVIGCGFVVRPFMSAILWATILCSATWPVHQLFRRTFRSRNLAAGWMTLLLSIVLIIPFVVVGFTFTDSIRSVLDRLGAREEPQAVAVAPVEPAPLNLVDPAGEGEVSLSDPNKSEETQPQTVAQETKPESSDPNLGKILPPLPAWVERIPWVGKKIGQSWADAQANAMPTLEKLKPYLKQAGFWLLGRSLDLVQGVLQLVLSVLIAFFLYRDGEGLVTRLDEGFRRISGDNARHLIDVVKITVRSVVYGVIGTGLAQGMVAGIGFYIASVPSFMLLALFTFFLSFIP